MWLPGQATSQPANETFAYNVTGTAPSIVTTHTLRENGSYATEADIYDGMLQLRQQQQTPANGAAGRLLTDTFYDSHGWAVKTSSAYYDATTAPDGTLFAADDDQVPIQTVTQYDGQGRATASQFYSLGTFQWQTTTSYPGADETDATAPKGGTATSAFTNALGETTATGPTTTPPRPPARRPTRRSPATPTPRPGNCGRSPTPPGTSGPTATTCWGRGSPRPTRTRVPRPTATTRTATSPRARTPAGRPWCTATTR